MGVLHAPMGIEGEGEIEATAEGLKLTGLRKFRSGGAVGCLGFFVGVVVGVAVVVGAGVSGGAGLATVAGLVGAVAAVLLARRLSPPRRDPVVLPWDRVASLELDGPHVSFVSRGKPGGQVWFFPSQTTPTLLPAGTPAAPPNAVALRKAQNLALIDELRAVAAASGAKVSGRR